VKEKKLCPICKEQGKSIEACQNNGLFCYVHMQYLQGMQFAYAQSGDSKIKVSIDKWRTEEG
jgi:hypothetical protein